MKQLLRELHELKARTLRDAENTTWVVRDTNLGIHHALQYMLDDYDARLLAKYRKSVPPHNPSGPARDEPPVSGQQGPLQK